MKFSKISCVAAALSIFASATHDAHAWNAEGHMVVAQIAYNHLKPEVKAKCDALIAQSVYHSTDSNSNFVSAAAWADDIKSFTSAYNTWHYIDIPFSLDGMPTNGFVPDSFDVVKAINQCVTALTNPATTISNQAMNLRFLLHFVGDIQQPLHCSTAISTNHSGGDLGGNSFTLNYSPGNLHSLWDQGGGYLNNSITRPFNNSALTTLSNKVFDVESVYPYAVGFNSQPNPMDWAVEGWWLAKTNVYVGITEGDTPSGPYLTMASNTTRQRMAAGGQRLADLLNFIFASRTNFVLNAHDSGAGSLRSVVGASPPGGYIFFDQSLSGQQIVLTTGEIVLSNNITINGSGLSNGVTISANSSSRIFNVTNATASLVGLTLTGGYEYTGGAVYGRAGSSISLLNCTCTGSHAAEGGAIVNDGSLLLWQCTLSGNDGDYGGALQCRGPTVVSQCTIANNTSGFGGGIFNGSTSLMISNSIISENSANSLGQDIYAEASNTVNFNGPNIVSSVFTNSGAIVFGMMPNATPPLLAPLGNYGGPTATMPPLPGSSAVDGIFTLTDLLTDQRGYPRPAGLAFDFGAVEGIYNPAGPGKVEGPTRLAGGSIRFSFTNVAAATFSVLTSTNLSLPLNTWNPLGFASEVPVGSGNYQFTDSQNTNAAQRFYRAKAP